MTVRWERPCQRDSQATGYLLLPCYGFTSRPQETKIHYRVQSNSLGLASTLILLLCAVNLGKTFCAWDAAVLKKAALARALRSVWPPRLDRRMAERVTSVIAPRSNG